MRNRIKSLVLRAAGKLSGFIEQEKIEVLRKRLGHCGKGVSFRLPIVIESPEMVRIGDSVSIASFVHMWGNGGITIGERTMIGSHVAITSATHDSDSPEMYLTLITRPVTIHHDVWIGTQAIIFPGVTIGAHAIVGAGALVKEDVPAYAVVAGLPARIIRVKKIMAIDNRSS